ncbi:MAG: O-antigen ligase family protein [Candidatus Limnocylindria bacterium]
MPRSRGKRRQPPGNSILVSPVRRIGVALLAAELALLPVVFDTQALYHFVLPKALLSQALGYGTLAAIVVLAFAFGRRALPPSPVHWAVVAYVAAHVVATATALDRYLAVFGSGDQLLGLVAVLDAAILYFGLVILPRTAADLRLLVMAALAGGVLAMTYGLVQAVGFDPIDWRGAEERPVGTLGNATVFGHYLAVIAAGALALAVRRGADARERLALAVLGVAFYFTAITTGTRAVMLALPVLALVLLARGARAVPERLRTIARVGVPAAVIVMLALTVVAGGDRLASLFARGLEDSSTAVRLGFYGVAAAAVIEHPITGVGPDNYEVVYPDHRSEQAFGFDRVSVPETSPHSWLAKLATDAGALGLIGFGALLVSLVITTLRNGVDDVRFLGWALLGAYLAVGLVSVTNAATHWLLWVGAAAVARGSVSEEEGAAVRAVRRVPQALTVTAFGLAAALALLAFPAWAASRSAQASVAATSRGDFIAAATVARAAVSLDPHRAIYWHHLAIAYTRQELFGQATDAFEAATERAPHNAVHLANLSRAQLALGLRGDDAARARALETARRAVELDPNNPDPRFALALAAAANDLPKEAARESERGLALDPSPQSAGVYEVAARSYLALERPEDAERWSRAGLARLGGGAQTLQLRLYLARALVLLDRPDEALREVDAVLALDPANQDAARIKQELEQDGP